MKESSINKLLRYCILIIVFFVQGGFYTAIALALKFAGSGGTRLVTVPIRLLTTILMISILVLLIFYARIFISKTKKIILYLFCLFWVLYLAKLFIHYNNAYYLNMEWYEYILYAVNFSILPFIVFSLIPFQKFKIDIINTLIFSGFVMGVVCFIFYRDLLFMGADLRDAYYASAKYQYTETLSPLSLSYVSVVTSILCIYKFMYHKPLKTGEIIYLIITVCFSVIMFLLGASRGSLVAFGASIIYFIFTSNIKNKIRTLVLLIISTPILIWSVTVSNSSIFRRTSETNETGTGREELWKDAMNEFLQNPIIGGRIEIGFQPHNIFIESLMAMGILGFLLLVYFIINSLVRASLQPKVDSNYIWVSCIFIQGLAASIFSGSLWGATLLFFPMGLLFSYDKIIKKRF